MNNSGQIAQTVANTLTENKGVKSIQFAITGDAVSDLMAGIRAVCDDSRLSARQVQFIMECYEKLYKDAADDTDKREREREIGKWKSPFVGHLEHDPRLDQWRPDGLPAHYKAKATLRALQNDSDNACNGLRDAPVKKNTP